MILNATAHLHCYVEYKGSVGKSISNKFKKCNAKNAKILIK